MAVYLVPQAVYRMAEHIDTPVVGAYTVAQEVEAYSPAGVSTHTAVEARRVAARAIHTAVGERNPAGAMIHRMGARAYSSAEEVYMPAVLLPLHKQYAQVAMPGW